MNLTIAFWAYCSNLEHHQNHMNTTAVTTNMPEMWQNCAAMVIVDITALAAVCVNLECRYNQLGHYHYVSQF